MLCDGASKTVVECNCDLKHEFLGPARGLTDTGAQQPVVGASAALRCLESRVADKEIWESGDTWPWV